MLCPICEKEMTIENVETSPARQGFSADGSGVIDATYQDMWWCEHCQEAQPIENDDFDTSDEARDTD
jgi:hypothetical protein